MGGLLNHIDILGRLTKDPELRYTTSNVPVCSFTVAVDRDFGADESGKKPTDFIDVVAWRQTGEFVSKYFSKGSMIAVSGRMESRKWTDRDGNKRTSWEINAESCYFGGSRSDSRDSSSADPAPQRYSSGSTSQPSGTYPAQGKFTDIDPDDDDGELPF